MKRVVGVIVSGVVASMGVVELSLWRVSCSFVKEGTEAQLATLKAEVTNGTFRSTPVQAWHMDDLS